MAADLASPLQVDGFVLAGGKSTRMGRDKALLEFNGAPLIERALQSLKTVVNTPRIAGQRQDLVAFAPIVPDHYAGFGPLGGIHAGLAAADQEWSIFMPVDLPLLPAAFLRLLVERVAVTRATATIPVIGGRPQPLVAIYHQSLLPGIQKRLETGDLGTLRAMTSAAKETGPGNRIDFFCIERLAAAGQLSFIGSDLPYFEWFRNVNTPSEMLICASERLPILPVPSTFIQHREG